MYSRLIKSLSVLGLAAVVVMVSHRGAVADPRASAGELVGAWRVQVTQVDCNTGAPLSPVPFSSVLTFAVGGTMVEDTTNPAFGPGQRSIGQGGWAYQGHHTYGAKSLAFINYTTPPNPAAHNPGFNAGEQTILQTISYKEASDTWMSAATIAFIDGTDPSTVPYRTGCAVASASRF
jgi:hypothetical protein